MTGSVFNRTLRDEAEDEAEGEQDRPRKRHPMDFDIWPSDEQAEAFKRGER